MIIVAAEVTGPSGIRGVRLHSTRAQRGTFLNTAALVSAGYDPAAAPERVQVTTGSGIEFAPLVRLESLAALGQVRNELSVLCHTLPPSAGVDGLLGLDFFRGKVLTVDFAKGELTLTP